MYFPAKSLLRTIRKNRQHGTPVEKFKNKYTPYFLNPALMKKSNLKSTMEEMLDGAQTWKRQTKDAPDHEIECFVSQKRGRNFLLNNEARLVIRALAKNYREQHSGILSEGTFFQSRRSILNLKTHLEDLTEEDRAEVQRKAQKISALIRPYTQTEVYGAVLMLQRLRINMFQLSDHRAVAKGIACYLGISVVDHTCEDSDDFVLAFNGRDIVLKAMKNFSVADMSEFRINYIDSTIPYKMRHKALLETYYFDCRCSKCLREAQCDYSAYPDEENDEILRELDNMYLTRHSNEKWFQKGIDLLNRMNETHRLHPYRRDLCVQIQNSALSLGLYEDSLRYGIMALEDAKILHRGEPSLVSFCLAMKALGWNDCSHQGNKVYEKILRLTTKLLRWTYGRDYALIDDIRNPQVTTASN